jgi:flagellar biosynthesis/type III secretory pathway M-ring protein FliF/YscJ
MNNRTWNNALQEELTRWISNFPGVESAGVIVGNGERQGLGTPKTPSSATVNLRMKSGAVLSSAELMAVVDVVLGAVPGMDRANIHVTDGHRSYRVPTSNTPMPEDLMEFKKAKEDSYSQKLLALFDYVGDIKIAVNVEPDMSTREREVQTFDPKGTVVKARSETSHEMTSTEGSGAEGQPGVPPNTGMTTAETGSGRKQSTTSTDTTTDNVVGMGSMKERISLPAGTEIKELTASLSLPRSYLVHLFQRMNHDPKADPDDDKLQPVITSELKRTQVLAKNAIGAKADDQVKVDWFDDTMAVRSLPGAAPQGGGGGLPIMVAQYARQGVLAVVALMALGMMLMMVRKAVPAADGGAGPGFFFGGKGKRGKSEIDRLDAGDDVFGEANQGEAVLTGIELDDDTLQSRKMVDEVSTMIKENPENAAALVKRWMTKGK